MSIDSLTPELPVDPIPLEPSPLTTWSNWLQSPINGIRAGFIHALIAAIKSIPNSTDRQDVLLWLMDVQLILSEEKTTPHKVQDIYASMNSLKALQVIGDLLRDVGRTYCDSNYPMALKVALPATAVSASVIGAQGAGIAAFGTAIGLPVLFLVFIGVAGVTSVIEAFIKDPSSRDPLVKLIDTLIKYENQRRISKELAAAMRAEPAMPERSTDLPSEDLPLIASLRMMDSYDFEKHTMSFFQSWGFDTAVTRKSNDFGLDGYVLHNEGVIAVQCKRNSENNPVGGPDIQRFQGAMADRTAYRGYVVTTSYFTEPAYASARLSKKIVLIDIAELLTWHHGASIRRETESEFMR
jgi:hypothetical protein